MKGGSVALVAGLAGFFLGGVGVFFATDAQRTVKDVQNVQIADEQQFTDLFERLRAAEAAEQGLSKRLVRVTEDETQLRAKVRELIERIDALEKRGASGPRTDIRPNPDKTKRFQDIGAQRRRFEELRAKVWSGDASADEEAEFWKAARESGVLDEILKDLEEQSETNPRDTAALMNLARGYTAKLLSVPDGPERGAWAVKGEAQYQKVLEIDPEHWVARFSLAFSWSQWPAFANKGPAAIDQFEKLRDIQERGVAQPRQSRVYVQLATLYRTQGNAERAQKTLEDGLERHPGDPGLKDALDAATR